MKASKTLQQASKLLRRKRLNTQSRVDLKPDSKASTPTNLDTQVDTKKLALEDKPKVVPVRSMKQHKVACFKNKKGTKNAEYDRQLAGQEAGINKMTVKEYLDNRKAFKAIGRKGTGKAQAQARLDHQGELIDDYSKKLAKTHPDWSKAERKIEAEKRAKADMKTLHALHNPDMIAGGKDEVSGLGDAGVNQSIGAQWKTAGYGQQQIKQTSARVDAMDEVAANALATTGPDTPMNVHLHRCK